MRPLTRNIIILVAAAIFVAAYFILDPASSGIFPRCPFLTVTGWQCPGCGSQRAIHCLLHGDITGAWGYNAMLVASLPLIGLLMAGELTRRRYPKFYASIHSRWLIAVLAIIVIAWWIGRNLI